MISSAPLVSCPLFLDFVTAEPGNDEASFGTPAKSDCCTSAARRSASSDA